MQHPRQTRVAVPMAAALVAVAISFFGGAAFGYQGHMWAAKTALNNALHQLQVAEPDKAGHRDQAIGLVNQAITQVQQGIAAGAR
ncbi:MAG TPA: hypothetical protein VEJ20_03120 [Candidatus Eremiobacteraceae bacterium]|nr:hypothetical protein [Candidatus Eremiobacteraceae bacterium]